MIHYMPPMVNCRDDRRRQLPWQTLWNDPLYASTGELQRRPKKAATMTNSVEWSTICLQWWTAEMTEQGSYHDKLCGMIHYMPPLVNCRDDRRRQLPWQTLWNDPLYASNGELQRWPNKAATMTNSVEWSTICLHWWTAETTEEGSYHDKLCGMIHYMPPMVNCRDDRTRQLPWQTLWSDQYKCVWNEKLKKVIHINTKQFLLLENTHCTQLNIINTG